MFYQIFVKVISIILVVQVTHFIEGHSSQHSSHRIGSSPRHNKRLANSHRGRRAVDCTTKPSVDNDTDTSDITEDTSQDSNFSPDSTDFISNTTNLASNTTKFLFNHPSSSNGSFSRNQSFLEEGVLLNETSKHNSRPYGNNSNQTLRFSNLTTDSINSTSPVQSVINGSQDFNTSFDEAQNITGLTSKSFTNSNSSLVSLNSTQNLATLNSLVTAIPTTAMKQNNLFLGFLPDDGSSGGTRTTMAQLNSAIGSKSAVYGWYGQAHSGTLFDGSQLLAVIDDVKSCNCVFQPAVMPVGGWKGLTPDDNSQAIAIAKVMKKFTDEGIPVWLRFAHEVNFYQTDGTYQGTASDFKTGWATVSAAMKNIAPDVKMWWTPNIDSVSGYEKYEPSDMSTVDLVGIDYYPKKLTGNDFIPNMKAFHDKYAIDGRKFAIGETGLGYAGSTDDKYKWLNEICASKSSLPEFISMAWFNFDKEYDYKIAGEPSLNTMFTSFIAKT